MATEKQETKSEHVVSKSMPRFMLDVHRENANGMQMCLFTSWKALIKCEQAEHFPSLLVNNVSKKKKVFVLHLCIYPFAI